MPRARLSISVPEGTWIHEASVTNPDAEFRVTAALAGERSGIALVELRTADPLSVILDADRNGDVVDLDLLWKRETEALLQVETRSPPLLVPVWRAGVPIELPFTVRDGEATWELTTSSDRFSALGSHLEELGVEYAIEYVHEIGRSAADRITTERQREVLSTALDLGYYATPREATLTDVADELDVSKATCSEILHRVEGNVLDWFADEHLDVERARSPTW